MFLRIGDLKLLRIKIMQNDELIYEGMVEDVSDELKNNFGDLVYDTIIPRNVRLAEAPSYGKPAMYYDKSSLGSKAYLALAAEVIEKA